MEPPDKTLPFPTKTIVIYSLLVALCLVALIFSVLSQVRVHRLFQYSEPSLNLSTLYITLSLIMLCIGCVMNIITTIINYEDNGKETDTWHNLDVIADSTLTYHLFFIMGVFLFDLHKWVAFLVTTDTMEGQIGTPRGSLGITDRIERRINLIDMILIVSQVLLSCAFLTILIGYLANYENSDGETSWILARSKFVLTFYVLFLLLYCASFYLLQQRLRRYFPDFYKSERGRVLSLCACILVSIIGRIIMSAILSVREIVAKIIESVD